METKTFTLFWLTGDAELVKGENVAKAMTLAGYSNGAVSALDFYAEGNQTGKYVWVKNKWIKSGTTLGIVQNQKLLLHSNDNTTIEILFNNLSGKNFKDKEHEYESYIKNIAVPDMGINPTEPVELVEVFSLEPLNYVSLSRTTIKI